MYERGVHKPSILTIQIIVVALMLGIVSFGAVVLIGPGAGAPQQGTPIVALVMAGMAATVTFARFVVPPILVSSQRRASLDEHEERQRTNFLGVFQTKTIVANALTEGGAFGCLIAYITDGQWWSLAIVGGILALMIVDFPTQGKFDNWYRTQRELAEMER